MRFPKAGSNAQEAAPNREKVQRHWFKLNMSRYWINSHGLSKINKYSPSNNSRNQEVFPREQFQIEKQSPDGCSKCRSTSQGIVPNTKQSPGRYSKSRSTMGIVPDPETVPRRLFQIQKYSPGSSSRPRIVPRVLSWFQRWAFSIAEIVASEAREQLVSSK